MNPWTNNTQSRLVKAFAICDTGKHTYKVIKLPKGFLKLIYYTAAWRHKENYILKPAQAALAQGLQEYLFLYKKQVSDYDLARRAFSWVVVRGADDSMTHILSSFMGLKLNWLFIYF